jgi:hypothetical protein
MACNWCATGVKDDDFGKPIITIANSFTQFVPGHVHLKDMAGNKLQEPLNLLVVSPKSLIRLPLMMVLLWVTPVCSIACLLVI